MESHVLNTYHQARYRSIGHNILRSESEARTSTEYEQPNPEYQQYGQYWNGHDWSRNQTINMTRSQNTSSDEEENIEVQELTYEDQPSDSVQVSETDNPEEQVLVEGADYDVIQVFAVDPDLDMEASTDDEECDDFAIKSPVAQESLEPEYPQEESPHRRSLSDSQGIDGLNFNLDTPVVSNVDEYFIKEDIDKDILAVKDEPVVKDVDEYFIKEEKHKPPNVDDFFIKEKLPDHPQFEVPKTVNVEEFFVQTPNIPQIVIEQNIIDQNVGQNVIDHNIIDQNPIDQNIVHQNVVDQNIIDENGVDENVIDENVIEQNVIDQNIDQDEVHEEEPINESDLEVLPNIEDLKRFLLEDMTYTKFKSAQRSCSLPQSPMHNICLDIDDAKTCLSFEDLNLDLSDLTFDNEKDRSANSSKSDDVPRALTDEDVNSFLITSKSETKEKSEVITEDDLSHQDMEIEHPVESIVNPVIIPQVKTPVKLPEVRTSTPIKPTPPKSTVLNFCIEKTTAKKEKGDVKAEPDDFVDVESCNDTVIPVLEANNLNSLLEQFEATEKLNTKPKKVIKSEEPKVKSVSLTNGMRLQDAGVQLNKTKMRQILMPSTVNATVRRSPSPVHSDHDYCSSKKRFSLPNIKSGQSLLKPEVLSSNSRILSSRHRSCKNKKVVYALSSDDESEKNNKNKKPGDDNDIKMKKPSVKQTVKVIAPPTRKKLSPVHSASNDFKDKDKSNSSVIVKDACKASDTPCSQNSNGSIKLTIKNKSEVILNCDVKDSQKDKPIEKCKSSLSEKTETKAKVDAQNNIKNKSVKNIKELDSNKKSVSSIENCTNVVKEEARPKAEHFYTALFSNKQDVQIPQVLQVKPEKRSFEEEISIVTKIPNKNDVEQPQKRKKLNLREYKMRRCVSSNNSSAQVSPEAIFPDMPNPFNNDKTPKCIANQIPPNGMTSKAEQSNEAPKKIFDPIREASRKILMNTKKQKAEAMRKRDEDIVMSKIPKVENLELQPLISDAEMLKIVGMAPVESKPVPMEKPQVPAEFEEIVMVSIGTNTDENVFKELESSVQRRQSQSPTDAKSLINFKIKKSDHVLKQNVFDSFKRDKKSPVDDKKAETKIDRARYKDITAALKSVEKQVDTISSNSLFASIQDVVMKKAPEKITERKCSEKRSKSNSPKRKAPLVKATIVREYDVKADHGEDKIILHLGKDRPKPEHATIITQTDPDPEFTELVTLPETKQKTPPRKRNDSDMSMSSESSPVRKDAPKTEVEKPKERHARSESKGKRSRSKERYEKYRRSRSRSRSRRRRRSHSRSRSRSRGRFRRYRRSDSPYRRKRRSRSPYRRRSPSTRRDRSREDRSREYRSNRSRSRVEARSNSPIRKKSPQHNGERKTKTKSMTPPPRKPTISESSDSSSSSSSSSSSDESRKSRRSSSSYRRDDYRKKGYRSPYSSEDRESNTPVEERRIVFVGKLEKDITKLALRSQFCKFGPVMEVRLHSKEDGTRYGFVTYQRAHDAWSAVEAASSFPQYDVGFGGRRAFCRQSYADLDGLEAKYTESAFHGQAAPPPRRDDDMSFEQMLLEMKKTLSQRKGDKKEDKP